MSKSTECVPIAMLLQSAFYKNLRNAINAILHRKNQSSLDLLIKKFQHGIQLSKLNGGNFAFPFQTFRYIAGIIIIRTSLKSLSINHAKRPSNVHTTARERTQWFQLHSIERRLGFVVA